MLGVAAPLPALPETLCEPAGPVDTAPPTGRPGWCLCGTDFKSSCQTPGRQRQRALATMHSSRGLRVLLLLLLLACVSGPAAALTEEESLEMVQLHNSYRAQVVPPAANMLHMVSVARARPCPTAPTRPPTPDPELQRSPHLSGRWSDSGV